MFNEDQIQLAVDIQRRALEIANQRSQFFGGKRQFEYITQFDAGFFTVKTDEYNTACNCHPEYQSDEEQFSTSLLLLTDEELEAKFLQEKQELDEKNRLCAEKQAQERAEKEAQAARKKEEADRKKFEELKAKFEKEAV